MPKTVVPSYAYQAHILNSEGPLVVEVERQRILAIEDDQVYLAQGKRFIGGHKEHHRSSLDYTAADAIARLESTIAEDVEAAKCGLRTLRLQQRAIAAVKAAPDKLVVHDLNR